MPSISLLSPACKPRPLRTAAVAVSVAGAVLVLPACGQAGRRSRRWRRSRCRARAGTSRSRRRRRSRAASCRSTSRTRAPIPDWLQDGGGVGSTAPGQTGSATQNLAEGNYVLISFPPEEGEPGTAEFKVEGGAEGELPKTSAEIIASEYKFDVKGLKPGKNKVLFKNAGQQLHHAIGMPMRPGKTLDDVRKFIREQAPGERPSGPPPVDFESGFETAVIDGGIEQVTDVEIQKPGKYAVVCFIQDRNGGPPHVMKGMISEVEIK